MDSKKIENAFVEVIEALGEVQYKEELKDTPKRIADSYKEIFYGIGINPKEVLKYHQTQKSFYLVYRLYK